MNFRRFFYEFIPGSLWIPTLIVVLVAIAAIVAIVGGNKPRNYISVPVEFCQEFKTGNTRSGAIPQTTCYGFDKNGACTMPITTYVDVTYVEISHQCAWSDWQ